MAQIVLVETNTTLKELITLNLQSYAEINVIPRENATDAKNIIEILPSIDLIITQNLTNNESTALLLWEFIEHHHLNIPLIILGAVKMPMHKNIIIIEDKKNWEMVIKKTIQVLELKELFLPLNSKNEFLPISSSQLSCLDHSCVDVFISLKADLRPMQFLKRFNAYENFVTSEIDDYSRKGITNFYIAKADAPRFYTYLSDHLIKKLDSTKNDLSTHIQFLAKSYNMAINAVMSLGLSPATVQLSECIIQSMQNSLLQFSNVADLLFHIVNTKASYLYQSAHLITIIGLSCLKNLELFEGQHGQKLAFSAFFHDIEFMPREELASIHSMEELTSAMLTKTEEEFILRHALQTSHLVRSYPNLLPDVADIILYHHGNPTGIGFAPHNLISLPFISKVFVIAQEFSKSIIVYPKSKISPESMAKKLMKKHVDIEIFEIIKAIIS